MPICISDRRDAELPAVGFVRLHDLESGKEVLVDTDSAAVRDAYKQARETARFRRKRLFRGLGIDPIEVRTDEDYVRPLLRFFHSRERRLGEGR